MLLACGIAACSSKPVPGDELPLVYKAMIDVREFNQDVEFSGRAQPRREPARRYPTLPYLLLGVRGGKGFRGYVSPMTGGPQASSSINVASSTKSFTAALILRLDQDRKLSIDDTLADPRWRNIVRWPNGPNITLRMVLAHTAGIPDYESSKAFEGRLLDPNWHPTPEQVIAFARRLPPLFKTNASWSYSNTDYQILGLVIEAVTGHSYADELQQRIFRPLGLHHTYLYGHQPGKPPLSGYFLGCKGIEPPARSAPPGAKRAYRTACSVKKPPAYLSMTRYFANDERRFAWSDGGIVSTTEDMTLWMTKLIASDEVLDASHRKLMQEATPQSIKVLGAASESPPSVRRYWVGYGLGLQIFRYDVGTGFGHGGNIEGFSSNCVYLPGNGNNFAMEIVAPLIQTDTAFDSSNLIATAVRTQH